MKDRDILSSIVQKKELTFNNNNNDNSSNKKSEKTQEIEEKCDSELLEEPLAKHCLLQSC